MQISRLASNPFELDVSLPTLYGSGSAAPARPFERFDRIEEPFVRRCAEHARRYRLTVAARMITRAGNGWIYPIVAAMLLLAPLEHAAQCVAAATVSLAIAFTLYPPLKRRLARSRPCDRELRIADAPVPLDRYSFPSGHAMTAAAFGVPVIVAAPAALAAIPLVIIGWALVCWSRIALGHHYPSDIVAGTLIGGAIATVVALVMV